MKKISTLTILLGLMLLFLSVYNYYRFIVNRDYVIIIPIECEPGKERCFEDQCLKKTDGQECYNKLLYYKLLHKRAYNIPECYSQSPEKRIECPPLACEGYEKDCFVQYCSKQIGNEIAVCSGQ